MTYRIGVDCDGVLANFTKAFSLLTKELHGKHVPEIAHEWDWWNAFLTPQEIQDVWDWIEDHSEWWTRLEPLTAENVRMLGEWRDEGHDVYVLTARRANGALYATSRWLYKICGWHVPVMVVRTPQEKGFAAHALGLTHFVDDKIENVVAVKRQLEAAQLPSDKVFLYDAPYNKGITGIPRIASLKELV